MISICRAYSAAVASILIMLSSRVSTLRTSFHAFHRIAAPAPQLQGVFGHRLASFHASHKHLRATPYDHLAVEQKWQKVWEDNNVFEAKRRLNHPKKYILDMFPYPSGAGLHVGHPEGYTATDILARYWRMRDYDVLHPMGWDAFGLPAEQHAINTGTHPAVTTYENIATFKRQLKSLGFSYDWSRELSTTDEGYVRFTQWIFLQLFKSGLAVQREVSVNWCPKLGTVLANEEIVDGLSERGSHPVERLPLRQWLLRITEYAERLEDDLRDLQWPEGTLTAQKQWIGRSEGANIRFAVQQGLEGTAAGADGMEGAEEVEVFTTRPDTIMGATYLVLAPENEMVARIVSKEQRAAVEQYVQGIAGKSDLERTATGAEKGKTGVFTGAFALHPISGQPVPIWIADYVLAGYGTGAVMAVPAHDVRDFEFAEKFGLPIKQVVCATQPAADGAAELPFVSDGVVCNSGPLFDGLTSAEARAVALQELERRDRGSKCVTYKLRDWVFSRQRYWGEPIPIYFPVTINSADGSGSPLDGSTPYTINYETPIAVPECELPLTLPEVSDFHPGDDPQGCLARAVEWRFFQRDGQWFARETNTMPQWAGSCWYYLRFADPKNTEALFSSEAASWLPVDMYIGGQEHAVLHLLYARFWHKVLFDLGIVDHAEPFTTLVHQGMILGTDGEKMSKSRGNVINPDDIVHEYGADALRMYEMFMGPLEAVKPWQTGQLLGVVRFRDRVYSLAGRELSEDGVGQQAMDSRVEREMHKTIKKVTSDIERLSFNTAIASLMVFSSTLAALEGPVPRRALEALVLLLSPIAPHVAEEVWQLMKSNGHASSEDRGESEITIAYKPWPTYDEALCEESVVTIAVQVSGKVRAKLEVERDISQEALTQMALDTPSVSKHLDGKTISKTIFVPGKILNLVAR